MTKSYNHHKAWRKRNPQKRNAERRKNYARAAVGCKRKGELWSKNEDLKILAPNRPRDRVLAKELGRSVQAIQVRRTKIRTYFH